MKVSDTGARLDPRMIKFFYWTSVNRSNSNDNTEWTCDIEHDVHGQVTKRVWYHLSSLFHALALRWFTIQIVECNEFPSSIVYMDDTTHTVASTNWGFACIAYAVWKRPKSEKAVTRFHNIGKICFEHSHRTETASSSTSSRLLSTPIGTFESLAAVLGLLTSLPELNSPCKSIYERWWMCGQLPFSVLHTIAALLSGPKLPANPLILRFRTPPEVKVPQSLHFCQLVAL